MSQLEDAIDDLVVNIPLTVRQIRQVTDVLGKNMLYADAQPLMTMFIGEGQRQVDDMIRQVNEAQSGPIAGVNPPGLNPPAKAD